MQRRDGGYMKKSLIAQCEKLLIAKKVELLDRLLLFKQDFNSTSHGGDEADQSASLMIENQRLTFHQNLRMLLFEIENALMRIQNGTYGICEETEEPIEVERLIAIPWTRLSVEGAEIRETEKRRKRTP